MTDTVSNQPVYEHSRETLDVKEKSYSYPFHAVLAQSIATLVVGITYFGIGAIYMIPTIVVGNLLNTNKDALSLNEDEASWLGGLPFLVMPVGALLGILVQGYLGQRYGLIVSNAFGLISLINMYYATSVLALLVSSTLSGLSLGFTEPAGMSYIGEYSEPRFRGIFCSVTMFFFSLGVFFESLMGTIVHWRVGTLTCALIPITSIILLFLIPDSPVWLLSKGRRRKSLKALLWFRGWVTEKDIEEEFEDLRVFVQKALTRDEHRLPEEHVRLAEGSGQGLEGTEKETKVEFTDLLMSLFGKRTLRPFFLLCMFQVIIFASTSLGPRSYIINLFKSFQTPVDERYAALAQGVAIALGNFSNTLVLRYARKRKVIAIISVIVSSLISIALGLCVYYKNELQTPWLFIGLIFLLNFIMAHCTSIPWLMLGEIFSVKNSTVACGITAVIFDLLMFLFLKTFFTLNNLLGTELFFVVNGLGGIVGSLCLYFYLPELEGKSLAEIDEMFLK